MYFSCILVVLLPLHTDDINIETQMKKNSLKWGRNGRIMYVQRFFIRQLRTFKQVPNEVPNSKQGPNEVPNEVPNLKQGPSP